MAFVFPEDKADFTAPNGVTYAWKDDHWVVKAFKFESGDYVAKPYTVYVGDNPPDTSVAPDGNLKEGELWYSTLTLELFAYGGSKWWPTAADFSGDITAINSALSQAEKDIDDAEQEIDDLQLKVAELEVTKGSVAKYKVKQTTIGAASRNGELITDSEYIEQITAISLAPFDINGTATKPVSVGDVVEFDMGEGNVARYTVTEGDSANAMTVAYNNGTGLIAVDQFIDIYIYPQNKAGASVDYVDEQDALRLLRSGDKTTGEFGIGKPKSNGDGFYIEGTLKDGTEGKILSVFHNNGTYVDAVNYSGRVNSTNNIQTKESVINLISEYAGAAAGGVPVGTVMMWLSHTPPDGWFLLKGDRFDDEEYSALHSVLQGMHGYETGVLPDMRGCYPAQGGNAHGNNLTPDQPGYFHGHRTAMPNGGAPTSGAEIPDGGARGFNGAGGTNAYSASLAKVTINEGWDTVTRPPTFAVNFIIYAGAPSSRREFLQAQTARGDY